MNTAFPKQTSPPLFLSATPQSLCLHEYPLSFSPNTNTDLHTNDCRSYRTLIQYELNSHQFDTLTRAALNVSSSCVSTSNPVTILAVNAISPTKNSSTSNDLKHTVLVALSLTVCVNFVHVKNKKTFTSSSTSEIIALYHIDRFNSACSIISVVPTPALNNVGKTSSKTSTLNTAPALNSNNQHVVQIENVDAPLPRPHSTSSRSSNNSTNTNSNTNSKSNSKSNSNPVVLSKFTSCHQSSSTLTVVDGVILLGGAVVDVKSGQQTPVLYSLEYSYTCPSPTPNFCLAHSIPYPSSNPSTTIIICKHLPALHYVWKCIPISFGDVFSNVSTSSLSDLSSTPAQPHQQLEAPNSASNAIIVALDAFKAPTRIVLACATRDNRVKLLPFFTSSNVASNIGILPPRKRTDLSEDSQHDFSRGVSLTTPNYKNHESVLFNGNKNNVNDTVVPVPEREPNPNIVVTANKEDFKLFSKTPEKEKKNTGVMGFSLSSPSPTTPTPTPTPTPTSIPRTSSTDSSNNNFHPTSPPRTPKLHQTATKNGARIKIYQPNSNPSLNFSTTLVALCTMRGVAVWDVTNVNFPSHPTAPHDETHPPNTGNSKSSNRSDPSIRSSGGSAGAVAGAGDVTPLHFLGSAGTSIGPSPIHYFACLPLSKQILNENNETTTPHSLTMNISFKFLNDRNGVPVLGCLFDIVRANLTTGKTLYKPMLTVVALKLSSVNKITPPAIVLDETNLHQFSSQPTTLIIDSTPNPQSSSLFYTSNSNDNNNYNVTGFKSQKLDFFFSCVSKAVTSQPRGLSCDGRVGSNSLVAKTRGVFRVKSGLQGGCVVAGITTPVLRHWLVETKPLHVLETKSDEEFVRGGGKSTIICDLTCSTTPSKQDDDDNKTQNLSPYRIVSSPCGNFVAVTFISFERCCAGVGVGVRPPTVIAITLLDLRASVTTFKLSRGRDVAWLSPTDIAILGDGGVAVKYKNKIETISASELECWRFFPLEGSRMIYAMADWSLMLGGVGLNKPHILTWENRKYQLKKGEEATSICECCGGKMAVGTSSRIILLQIDEMVALHQYEYRAANNNSLMSTTIVPLGSSAIFVDGGKLRYINAKTGIGLICSNVSGTPLEVKPDRLVYVDDSKVEVVTKPLFLLEAFVAACIDERVAAEVVKGVIKKFGRKIDWLPFKEGEGCGLKGVGISEKTVKALLEGGYADLAGLLLVASPNNSNVKYLPPWINLDSNSDWIGKKKVIDGEFESEHMYTKGLGDKRSRDELLLLDTVEEWLGKSLVGLKGAADDEGVKTLAEILEAERLGVGGGGGEGGGEWGGEGAGGEGEGEDVAGGDGVCWVKDVGGGRKEEDNLGAYWRFSDCDGSSATDLSKYGHVGVLSSGLTLSETTSPCDEGEEGKIKLLFDIVFEGGGEEDCFSVVVNRGGSLDVGVGHQSKKRSKCSVEFWFKPIGIGIGEGGGGLGEEEEGHDVTGTSCCLARRVGLKEEGGGEGEMVWQLLLKGDSKIVFSTTSSDVTNVVETKPNAIKFNCWNHVCLTIDSSEEGAGGKSAVTIFVKGAEKGAGDVKFDDLSNQLERGGLNFGNGLSKGSRLTEVRVWDCIRTEETIRDNMYECLKEAEMNKKKFIVKISGGVGATLSSSGSDGGGGRLLAKSGAKPFALAKPGGGGGESAAARRRRLISEKKKAKDGS